ncbi:hypothetical protein B0H19DRAFT_1157341 [Mycena capillaripes]|nr:hypothetical protein B0H19DRAFT_1157341 [Mycena capillaripes]
MNAKIRCDVCFESYTIDMFRFLPTCGKPPAVDLILSLTKHAWFTGHGLCIVCSEKTHTKRNCVICRHPKGSQDSVQIFLTFAETSPTDKARSVAENLSRIGPDSMPISVQKAGKKIRRALRDIEPEDEVARELLDAARNLDERIYPLFVELDLANTQVAALTAEIEELRQQLQVAASREEETRQLRRSLAEAKNHYNAAIALAKETQDAVLKKQDDNSRLSRTIQRQLSDMSKKEEEKDLLRAKLSRRDNRISLLEKKLKLLSRTVKHPKPDTNDPDESLQIDNSAEGIRIPRKSTDWVEPARVIRKNPSRVLKRIQPLPDIEL